MEDTGERVPGLPALGMANPATPGTGVGTGIEN